MALFYAPDVVSSNILPEEESQHAVKVLRLKTGYSIEVVDGVGGFYRARITHPHPTHCGFEIVEMQTEFAKRPYKLHLAIAPTKNIERLEWFIEKATEIGVDEITPIICQCSERKMVKEERLEKIIVAAAKQSIKAYFPTLNKLCTFDALLNKYTASQQFIAHCHGSPHDPLPKEKGALEDGLVDKPLLQTVIKKSLDNLIMIGPEGDFSREEVQKAIAHGFVAVSLGESRLRTETAGVVACNTVAIVNQ